MSELRLYSAATLADAAATITSTHAPTSGSVDNLKDDSPLASVTWPAAVARAAGFAIGWDFGVATDISHCVIGSGASVDKFPARFTLQSSANGFDWVTLATPDTIKWPGGNGLTEAPVAAAAQAVSTWGPYDKALNVVLSNGDRTYSSTTFQNSVVRSIVGKRSGRWYWELTLNTVGGANALNFGVWPRSRPIDTYVFQTSGVYRAWPVGLRSAGDVFGFALDLSNAAAGVLKVYRNNVLVDTLALGAVTEAWHAAIGDDNSGGSLVTANFGGSPFVFAPPSGFAPGLTEQGDDVYYSRVGLQVSFNGSDGSTAFTDDSPAARALTPFGGAVIKTDKSQHGGASGYFNGSARVAGLATDLALPGDFTIEFYAASTVTTTFGGIVSTTTNGSASDGWVVELSSRGLLIASGSAVVGQVANAYTGMDNGVMRHWAITRRAGVMRFFRAGAQIGQVNYSGAMAANANALTVGGWRNNADLWNGWIDDLRVTVGYARYVDAFVPPGPFITGVNGGGVSGGFSSSAFLPLEVKRLRFDLKLQPVLIGGTGVGAIQTQRLPLTKHMDMVDGGVGRITGTTLEKNTPANTPLRRRVRLYDERDGRVVAETWSSATTGAFEFTGVRMDRVYTVIAYDHLHNYRALIADNQVAERVP